jgi:Rod binding domain-containing protein
MLDVNPLSSNDLSRLQYLQDPEAKKDVAVQELERQFVRVLLKEMRDTVPEGKLFPGDPASRMQKDMLFESLEVEITKSGQLGLASRISEQLRVEEMSEQVKGRMLRRSGSELEGIS